MHEPLEADSLLENMKTTYDKFEPNKTSVMERSLERLFGDVSKGKGMPIVQMISKIFGSPILSRVFYSKWGSTDA